MSVSTATNLENATTMHVVSSFSGSSKKRPSGLTECVMRLIAPYLIESELVHLTATKKAFDQKVVWVHCLNTRYGHCLKKIQMVVESTLPRREVKRLCFEFEKLEYVEIKNNNELLLAKSIEKGCYKIAEYIIEKDLAIFNKYLKEKGGGVISFSFLDAAHACYLNTVRMLIKHGIKDDIQLRALEHAVSRGDEDIATALLIENKKLKKKPGLVYEAISKRQPKMVRLLLEHQVTITAELEEERRNGPILIIAMSCLKGSARTEIFRILLERGANMKSTAYMGDTPLMEAARDGKIEILKLLLTHAGNTIGITTGDQPFIDQSDYFGHTALMGAAAKNAIESVKILLKYKANVNFTKKGKEGSTALDVATRYHQTEAIQLLLEHGAKMSVSTSTNLENATTMHVVSSFSGSSKKRPSGLTECVMRLIAPYLIESELVHLTATKKAFDQKVVWVHYLHARYGHCLKKFQVVVESNLPRRGVKRLCFEFEKLECVEIKSSDKSLLLAIREGCYKITEYIIEKNLAIFNNSLKEEDGGGISSSFLKAAHACYLNTVRILIKYGIKDDIQLRALECAVSQGDEDIATTLLIENKEFKKKPGLVYKAISERQPKMVRLLLEHQVTITADLEEERRNGPILIIAMRCLKGSACTEIFRILLERGANMKSTAYMGNTPLMEAARDGNIEILKLLLIHAGNTIGITTGDQPFIDQSDYFGHTALMEAVAKNAIESVKILLKYKANVNFSKKGKEGSTALDVAIRDHQTGAIQLLLEHGAKSACDSSGDLI